MLSDAFLEIHDNLPGLRLVDYKRVGLPVYVAYIDVLTEEKRELHLVAEYCLRLISAGVSRFADLTALMGLSAAVIRGSVAELLRTGAIRGDESELRLTKKGEELLSIYGEMVCVESTWLVPYDGILRQPSAWRREQLLTPKQLTDAGHSMEIGPFGERPSSRELDVGTVWKVVAGMRPEKTLDRLISIRNVRRAPLRFVQAIALAYKGERDLVHVSFLVNGRLVETHSTAFTERGGVKRPAFKTLRGIDTNAAQLRSTVRRRLVRTKSGVQSVQGTTKTKRLSLPGRTDEPGGDVVVPRIYSLPDKFSGAISNATSRLIVTSRGISQIIVDDGFEKALATLLERNVRVHIGLGPDAIRLVGDAKTLDKPLERVRSLQSSFSSLSISTLPDLTYTHLIMDSELLVVGDYDWLSPDGSHTRTFRERWLLETSVSEIVDREAQYLERITLREEKA